MARDLSRKSKVIRGTDFLCLRVCKMTYVPVTPFRRPVEAAHLAAVATAEHGDAPTGVNKWEVLRELGVARKALGVTDRALSVLQALLSFPPETTLDSEGGGLIVFPSNASICDMVTNARPMVSI